MKTSRILIVLLIICVCGCTSNNFLLKRSTTDKEVFLDVTDIQRIFLDVTDIHSIDTCLFHFCRKKLMFCSHA